MKTHQDGHAPDGAPALLSPVGSEAPRGSRLDLDQFHGFTPGPWLVELGDDGELTIVDDTCDSIANGERDATLIAAAPALLAECRRQREEIGRLRAALHQITRLGENGCALVSPMDAVKAARAALAQEAAR